MDKERDTFGKIEQLGELAVIRIREGLLRIQRALLNNSNTSGLKSLKIYTALWQQCVIELEHDTKIRLNA